MCDVKSQVDEKVMGPMEKGEQGTGDEKFGGEGWVQVVTWVSVFGLSEDHI